MHDSEREENIAPCRCVGIRFCAKCKESDRVRQIFDGRTELKDSDTVIQNQQSKGRTSSCSFGRIGASKHAFCLGCSKVFETEILQLSSCEDHSGLTPSDVLLDGLFVQTDIITSEEEHALVEFFDNSLPFEGWKDSQSGRRKQDYGPRRNFKKMKVRPAHMPHMPLIFKPLFAKVSAAVEQHTGTPYTVAEVSVLEYTSSSYSNFDPHVDDTWLWGGRIAGLNMSSDCSMTFVNKENIAVEAFFPRRCFFLLSGKCRYEWMHGIRPENVRGRRISATFRELSDEILKDENMAHAVLAAAQDFV